MNMERDPFWDVFNIDSYDLFVQTYVHSIYLKPEVHADVRESFRVITRLLEFGYFEHRFFEVAYTKALLTVEMAFKQRYLELKRTQWVGDLWPLMNWLHTNHYFDVYNPYFMKNLRDLRNHFAHPTTGSFAGVGRGDLILYAMDLVNGLYEDCILTGQRKKIGKQLFQALEKMGPGYKITLGDETHYAFNIWMGFYNNKVQPLQIHLYVQPMYEIPKPYFFEGEKFALSPYYVWQATGITISEECIIFPDARLEQLEIRPITCSVEQDKFLLWQKEYADFDLHTHDRLRRSEFATQTFSELLRQFHKSP